MSFRVIQIEVDANHEAVETKILSLHSTLPDAKQAAEAAARAFARFGDVLPIALEQRAHLRQAHSLMHTFAT